MASFITEKRNVSDVRPILFMERLNITFHGRTGPLPVIKDMNLILPPGARTAVLGESGCGKSVMAMAIFRLLPRTAEISGQIRLFSGINLVTAPENTLRSLRGKSMVIIPQNPAGCLNPVFSVGFHLQETLSKGRFLSFRRTRRKAENLLADVGFSRPEKTMALYPHQLSGGMAQRVLLALGLAADPDLVVADEPTKGLDTVARDLFLSLSRQAYQRAAFLMITHDLEAAATCRRILVMYSGRIVEEGPADKVLSDPVHPYTRGLMAAHPDNGMHAVAGMPPALSDNPPGCGFYPRCPARTSRCQKKVPLISRGGDRQVRCCHA